MQPEVSPGAPAAETSRSARQRSRNGVERGGELGVTVPDEEPERPDPVADVHDQVAGLLRRPRPIGVPGYSQDVHLAGCRKTVSTVKKSHASRPWAWARRKARQDVSRPRGAGRYCQARRIRRTAASLIR